MGVIRQLKNFFTGKTIYPKTLTKAVYDENGERLDKILRDTMLAVDNEEYSGVEPRDADTLGGKYKAKDISNIEDKLTTLNSSLSHLNRFPDYSMGSEYINLKDSGITSYTIEEDGWVYLSMEVSTNAETAYIKYYINNSVVMTRVANIPYSAYTSLIPVSKGDVITYQDDTSAKIVVFSLRYYPFK